MVRDTRNARDRPSSGRNRLEVSTTTTPKSERIAAQVPSTRWLSGAVHMGQSAISPIPIAMGRAITNNRSIRTSASTAFIGSRLPSMASFTSRDTQAKDEVVLMVSRGMDKEGKLFRFLLFGFVAQIAGRLVDLQWHLTYEEFEGATEQLRAHWLIWLSTIFVVGVAITALRRVSESRQRRGYLVVVVANLAYGMVAVVHFFQHLDHLEVDWAHLLLAITSVAAAVGVLWVIAARVASRGTDKEAIA